MSKLDDIRSDPAPDISYASPSRADQAEPCASTPTWSEADRLSALDRYAILDTGREAAFDDVAALAADILDAPIAVVNLIAGDRQWFKAEVGIGVDTLPLDVSICRHAILQPGVFVVPDLSSDVRFDGNPLVHVADGLRFYAGALLETPDGLPLGTVCVLDRKARPQGLSDRQTRALKVLAVQTMAQLELRRSEAIARAESASAEKRARRLTLLSKASSLLLASHDPANVVRELFGLVAPGFQLDVAFHYRCGDGALQLVAAAGLTPTQERAAARIEFGQTVCGIVAVTREATHLTGIQISADPQVQFLKMLGLDTYFSAPLVSGEDLLGTLSFGRTGGAFSRGELEALRTLVAQLATALERQRAEIDLRTSEAELRFALKVGRFGAWNLDLASEALTTSETCRSNFGRDPRTPFSYADLRAAVHPDDQARMATVVERSIDTGEDYDIDYRIVTPEGETRWVAIRAQLARDDQGSLIRMAGVSMDITARKQTEDRLRDLNETLEIQVAERTSELRFHRDIIEATTSPICAFDTDFRLIAFNRAHSDEFFRIFGRRLHIGEVFPDLFSPDQAATIRGLMARALAGERYTVVEKFNDPGLAKPCWEINYAPLRNSDGLVIGAFYLANDISARLKAEAELHAAQDALRQSQKMEAMGSLTGGVAHDFNNLLTPIVGSLDLLQRRGLGGEREQRLIDGALQSAERAKTLVQRLLAFARRQPLKAEAVDVTALVTGMAGLVASTSGPTIQVALDIAADLPPALADANQVEMAILNLAVNARDAMPDGGRLTIAAATETTDGAHRADLAAGRYVRLSVADSGVGMDEATLKRAIEPFFSTKGVGKGTGLGLSMVHGLAAQLGGGLAISSKRELGTIVELWLPASAQAVRDPVEAEAVEASLTAGTALLVDDEELVRTSTADMLVELGYVVVEAGSAEEALALLDGGLSPDLLVTDHLMPGMSGTELIRVIGTGRHVRALVVSGYAEVEGIAADLPRLVKPFKQAELARAIATLAVASKAG